MTPASVVGNGNHDHRDVCSPDPLNEFIQSLDVHVALEGVGGFRVTGFWGDQVDGQAPCVLDVGSGGVEVGVTRDVLAWPSYGRKQDFLGSSTLKNIVRMKILTQIFDLKGLETSLPFSSYILSRVPITIFELRPDLESL